jgi:hypothetical protein
VFGGIAFGLLGARTSNKLGRDPIVILGFIIHIIAFFLIFLNLPNVANFGDTEDIGECQVRGYKMILIKILVFQPISIRHSRQLHCSAHSSWVLAIPVTIHKSTRFWAACLPKSQLKHFPFSNSHR